MNRTVLLLLGLLLVAVVAIALRRSIWVPAPRGPQPQAISLGDAFRTYWYNGQAEISTYTLDQGQYGANHPGEAVLVYVTEPFRTDKQVKLEKEPRPEDGPVRSTTVLKLNAIQKFVTGIYDYSVMTSVFTPVETDQHAIKITSSVQEWCGQSYLQLNANNREYWVLGRSYFEDEVAENYSVPRAWQEDELWTRLRFSPESLPTGEFDCIPGLTFSRLAHRKPAVDTATATLTDYAGGTFRGSGPLRGYTLRYPNRARTLQIVFERAAPYRIVGWEETRVVKGKPLTTRATLRKTIRSAYWTQNGPDQRYWRDTLGLKF
jgi:hypothetical protein